MTQPDYCRRRQSGFTLIEMMVAIVIGMILIGGVIQVFIGSKQTYRFQQSMSRVQESGRYALGVMTRDLRMVGYRGCLGPTADLTNTLNNPGAYEWSFDQGLQGHEATGGVWDPVLDAGITSPETGSDVLTMRVAEPMDITVTAHPGGNPPGSANLQISANSGLEQDDIVMVSDCQAAAVLQITNANPDGGTLVHNTGGGSTPGNATKDLGKEFADGTVTRLSTHTYYVRQGAGGLPSLWRRVNSNAAEELVENVEQMQVLYGVDTTGDRQLDAYQTASAVADWDDVLSVRISLLLAGVADNVTDDPQQVTFNGATFTAGDRRLRQVMTTTVALRNRLP